MTDSGGAGTDYWRHGFMAGWQWQKIGSWFTFTV